jgi:hypothetical protein
MSYDPQRERSRPGGPTSLSLKNRGALTFCGTRCSQTAYRRIFSSAAPNHDAYRPRPRAPRTFLHACLLSRNPLQPQQSETQ